MYAVAQGASHLSGVCIMGVDFMFLAIFFNEDNGSLIFHSLVTALADLLRSLFHRCVCFMAVSTGKIRLKVFSSKRFLFAGSKSGR